MVRATCATLIKDQLLPYPRSFSASSSKDNITLTWLATQNSNVAGYNLFRSAQPDTGFIILNTMPIADSFYVEPPWIKGRSTIIS